MQSSSEVALRGFSGSHAWVGIISDGNSVSKAPACTFCWGEKKMPQGRGFAAALCCVGSFQAAWRCSSLIFLQHHQLSSYFLHFYFFFFPSNYLIIFFPCNTYVPVVSVTFQSSWRGVQLQVCSCHPPHGTDTVQVTVNLKFGWSRSNGSHVACWVPMATCGLP